MITADGAELPGLPQARRRRGRARRPGRPARIDRGDHQRLRPAVRPGRRWCRTSSPARRRPPTVTDALGWQSVQVAEDNLIDLPTLEFKGKKWQDIRTALNKAPKEGVTFRMVTLADEPWSMVRQVEHLSQEWLGDKELPEMGFTLGGVTEALDPEVKVGLAVGADGKRARRDVVDAGVRRRRRDRRLDTGSDAPRGRRLPGDDGVPDRLLVPVLQGAGRVVRLAVRRTAGQVRRGSRAARPSSRSSWTPWAPPWNRSTASGRCTPSRASSSRGSRRCTWSSGTRRDLPRIGIAITRAYLPTAGVRDMLAVVKH